MSRVQNLVDAGMSVKLAHVLTGTVAAAVTAAGSDQSGATLLAADNNLITTASEGEGVRLPSWVAGDLWVVNGTAVTVLCYPPSGGQLNNAPANVALTMPPKCGAIIKPISSTQYLVVHS